MQNMYGFCTYFWRAAIRRCLAPAIEQWWVYELQHNIML
jgi:hypothetical protein